MLTHFKLKIITPYGEFVNTDSSYLYLYTIEGYMGVSPNQMPFIVPVEVGLLRFVNREKQTKICATGGGLLSVKKDEVKVFLRSCEYQEDIDIIRAKDRIDVVQKLQKEGKIDVNVAKQSIAKQLNRISVFEKQ